MRAVAALGALAVTSGALVAAAHASTGALANRERWQGAAADEESPPTYDGRFNFVRIRWEGGRGGARMASRLDCRGGREPLWAHDLCRRGTAAEDLFAIILDETTLLKPHLEGRVLTLDDPELFRYPVAYIVEVGGWYPSQAEADGLRNFLLKGGLIIVDDFRGPQELVSFQSAMGQVLPGVKFFPLEAEHELWDVFFHIPDPLALAPSTYPEHVPTYLGIYEENDPSGRLLAILKFNQDIGEYWEWSTGGFIPIPLTNEAYKYGVNYIIYSMTH